MTDAERPPPAVPERRGRGRPRKLDQPMRNKVCAMVSLGCNLRQAARYVGCSYPTIRRAAARDPGFCALLDRARRNSAQINELRRADPDLDHSLATLQQSIPCDPPLPAVSVYQPTDW